MKRVIIVDEEIVDLIHRSKLDGEDENDVLKRMLAASIENRKIWNKKVEHEI